jgi:hypothetical protein
MPSVTFSFHQKFSHHQNYKCFNTKVTTTSIPKLPSTDYMHLATTVALVVSMLVDLLVVWEAFVVFCKTQNINQHKIHIQGFSAISKHATW